MKRTYFSIDGSYNRIKRVMEYYLINGIEYGFYENREDGFYYMIHLDSGLAATSRKTSLFNKKEALEACKKQVEEIPAEKLNMAIHKVKKSFKEHRLPYPLNP